MVGLDVASFLQTSAKHTLASPNIQLICFAPTHGDQGVQRVVDAAVRYLRDAHQAEILTEFVAFIEVESLPPPDASCTLLCFADLATKRRQSNS